MFKPLHVNVCTAFELRTAMLRRCVYGNLTIVGLRIYINEEIPYTGAPTTETS